MFKRLPFLCLILFLAHSLSSCAFHDYQYVDKALHPKEMDQVFDYPSSSIKPYKCQAPCEIALINAETRTEKYVVWDTVYTGSYTPKKFAGTIVSYMGEEFARRGIKLNSKSPKKILVSLGEARVDFRPYSQKGHFELKISVPDLSYQKTYPGSDASLEWFLALAYSVHHSIMEFMKDPVVVKYIESRP